jgi:hypothetical protein
MPMVHSTFRRNLLLVHMLVLLAPWSAEALPIDRPLAEAVSRLTGWLTAWWADVGCSMDPDGRCHGTIVTQPSPPVDHLDVGCSADPDGGACGNRG